MFSNIILRPAARGTKIFNNRRTFSVFSVHSTFPATLYRYQLGRESKLYDRKLQQEDDEVQDAVDISKDGLIYPELSPKVSNGATFMPNTHYMQELTRRFYEYCLDNLAGKQGTPDPFIITVWKGTPIPSTLVLLRQREISNFALQPSSPMSLNDLNAALTEFYAKSSTIIPAAEWLDEHQYHEASVDENDDWMQH